MVPLARLTFTNEATPHDNNKYINASTHALKTDAADMGILSWKWSIQMLIEHK